jgi:hypothetical protein
LGAIADADPAIPPDAVSPIVTGEEVFGAELLTTSNQ